MSQEKAPSTLLIVSDDADELRSVRELLKHDGWEIFGADSEDTGLRLFEERRPALLVLAFQDLEGSERFYLRLYRQCPVTQEVAHQTLLLCKHTEAEAAFSLCRNGTLDDYHVNRPMHDPLRLRLAVHQALAQRDRRSQSASMRREFSHIGSDLRHLDNHLTKALAGGQQKQAESLQVFREFANRLNQELEQFQSFMSDSAKNETASFVKRNGLHQQFERMRQDRVEPEVRMVEDRLQETQQWSQQLLTDYRELADLVGNHAFPPAEPEVMLVDDDDVYREMLAAMLEEVKLRAHAVESGEAALAEMRKRPPSIVLLDYNMPGLNGIETLKEIKADPELRHIPVVMLTGLHDRDTVKEVITSGAAGFIVKPSNRPTILAKIRNLLPKGTLPPESGV